MADEMFNVQVKTDFYSQKQKKEGMKRKERISAFTLLIVFKILGQLAYSLSNVQHAHFC